MNEVFLVEIILEMKNGPRDIARNLLIRLAPQVETRTYNPSVNSPSSRCNIRNIR